MIQQILELQLQRIVNKKKHTVQILGKSHSFWVTLYLSKIKDDFEIVSQLSCLVWRPVPGVYSSHMLISCVHSNFGLQYRGVSWYRITVQYRTLHQCNTVCYGLYSTIQCITVQCSTEKYSTVQTRTVQYKSYKKSITVQYSTVQHSTAQHSTVQYSTVQYSTVQYSPFCEIRQFFSFKGLLLLFKNTPFNVGCWLIYRRGL